MPKFIWQELITGTRFDKDKISLLNFMFSLIIMNIIKFVCIFDMIWLTIIKPVFIQGYVLKTVPSEMAPLADKKRRLFVENVYFGHGIAECLERVVVNAPKELSTIVFPHQKIEWEEDISLKMTKQCINMGPYNYLGYAGDYKYDANISYVSTCSSLAEGGVDVNQIHLHEELAQFLGKEKAIAFPMGWDTNASVIPLIVDHNTLVLSDEKNHSSIAAGCKIAKPKKVICFKNNDANHLDLCILKELYGDTVQKSSNYYSKIVIFVEGIYSMEGEILDLKSFINIKKKYNAYLYIDEAHSIGAIGSGGKGICSNYGLENWKMYANEVDILMGTFTKSFSSIGGYIASNKEIIDGILTHCSANIYDTSLSPTCISQIRKVISDLNQNSCRVEKLKSNAIYLRNALKKKGIVPLGDPISPVVPVLTYTISRAAHITRYCFKKGVAVVLAGFPATDIYTARIRLCISSAHTEQQLDDVVNVLSEAMQLNMANLKEIYCVNN